MNGKVFFARSCVLIASAQAGCQHAPPPTIMSSLSPVELRAMQTRIYPLTDRGKALRSVISTMQDLGYNIDKVSGTAGTASAVKLSVLRMSIAVTQHGPGQMAVRANAEIRVENRGHQVDDPLFYQQDFFEPFSDAIALTATPDPGPEADPTPVPAPELPDTNTNS